MGASDHLGLVAAAAKPRNGSRPCAAVLGEPLPVLDDPGLLVHPSADFAAQALVSSTQQVIVSFARTTATRALPFCRLSLPFRFVPIRAQMGGARSAGGLRFGAAECAAARDPLLLRARGLMMLTRTRTGKRVVGLGDHIGGPAGLCSVVVLSSLWDHNSLGP